MPELATDTADAVSLLVYLIDALPRGVSQAFAGAEDREAIIQTPGMATRTVKTHS